MKKLIIGALAMTSTIAATAADYQTDTFKTKGGKAGFITGENICIDMHLRRSRQVPRRATRGALQSKVARGCAA